MDKSEILKIIQRMERKHNVRKGLLEAVVQRESNFDVQAKGQAGEVGLAQLLTKGGAIADYEQEHTPLDDYRTPENNLEVAAWYLGNRIPRYLKHYKLEESIENIVISYNAGIGRAVSGNVPSLTRGYILEIETALGKKKVIQA